MALTTYAELQAAVANWLARDDLTTYIPDFITLAETSLRRRLRVLDTETTSTLVTVSGTATVSLPARFTAARALWINEYISLDFRTPGQGEHDYSGDTGQPVAYSISGSAFRLYPKPDAVYTINITYMAYPEPLSDSNTSNAWLTECPDAILFGSLLEAVGFNHEDARVGFWQARYDRAIAEMEQWDNARRYPLDGLQARTDRRVY